MALTFLRPALACASLAALMSCSMASLAQGASLDAGIASLQHRWAVIQYRTPGNARADQFAALASEAGALTAQFPRRAESHTWEGIALSSWAGAKGGLGALGIAKRAKREFETAIEIDPKALGGSALDSLGVLYYKVPGWPVGFGDNSKAESLLKQALAINPDGIDANYFYADYLMGRKRYADAVPYLQKALQAPPRPGRGIADDGRRKEARQLLERAEAEKD